MAIIILPCLAGTSGMVPTEVEDVPISSPAPAVEPVSKSLLMGRFKPAENTDFELIHSYNYYPGMYLHKRTKAALDSLVAAAARDDIFLNLVSATWSFDLQKTIWERKIKLHGGQHFESLDEDRKRSIITEILKSSSMPTTSRHHWGTDVDFCSVELSFWDSPIGKRNLQWLQNNATSYGFNIVYSSDREGGYSYEPWHWTYLPLSRHYLQEYLRQVSYDDITGFTGAEFARDFDVINEYVANVSPSLLP
ncbi:MAG: D-alanyl-D-alanine carboxypeptidase family protein [Candidatus Cloacimonetes bacterium]|nr:D-alanyl-D-alanine carboxypeptidase family protein [Candidatus Cloacimonadota bacterium]MDD4559731.1 D-alanyl-D-alanine carboxypeptidase family protein [Candidatus Cloacimonadota bacterium]